MQELQIHSEEPVAGNLHGGFCGGRKGVICASTRRFISYQTLRQYDDELTNFLVLNSLSFLEKSREMMEKHQHVKLYLDRDEAGMRNTQTALKWDTKYIDKSHLYNTYKDLNDYLACQGPRLKQGLR